jgi:hypothetical protein
VGAAYPQCFDLGEPAIHPLIQDPRTKTITGEAFVQERCHENPHLDGRARKLDTWNDGCADVVWDKTGAIISLKIRWQRQEDHPPSQEPPPAAWNALPAAANGSDLRGAIRTIL